jgi:hypothetical protein
MDIKKFFKRATVKDAVAPFNLRVYLGESDTISEGIRVDDGVDSANDNRPTVDVTLYGLGRKSNSSTGGDGNMADDNPKDVSQGDELFSGDANTRSWDTNLKRTYDEYQDLALTSARRSQVNFDQLNNVALQALQNAVTVANEVANQTVKHTSDTDAQKVRHADIAIEGQWESVEEVAMAKVAAHIAADHAPHD